MEIRQFDCPHADCSLVLAAYRAGIPCTVHVALGTDVVHMHSHVSGAALGEASLLIFADTPGLFRDPSDETTLIGWVSVDEADQLVGTIQGRARTKLRASIDARKRGVSAVGIADGRVDRPIAAALSGQGTWLR